MTNEKISITNDWSWPVQARICQETGQLELRPLTLQSALSDTYCIDEEETDIYQILCMQRLGE